MVNPNEGLRFDAFLFILFCGKLRLGEITGFSAHRVMPDRVGDQAKKDDQAKNNFLPIIHKDTLLRETSMINQVLRFRSRLRSPFRLASKGDGKDSKTSNVTEGRYGYLHRGR